MANMTNPYPRDPIETYTWQIGLKTGEGTRVDGVMAQEHRDDVVYMHNAKGELIFMAPVPEVSYMKRLSASVQPDPQGSLPR